MKLGFERETLSTPERERAFAKSNRSTSMSVAEIIEMPTEKLTLQVKEAHLQANQCALDALGYAIKCGELLTKAKASCKHGEFSIFVMGCGITPRTAQNYMKLFSEQTKIPTYKDRVGAISIRDALKLLSSPKKEKDTQDQKRIKYNQPAKCETRFAFEDDSTPNPKTTLSADDRERIDRQVDMGMSPAEIAEDNNLPLEIVQQATKEIESKHPPKPEPEFFIEDDIDELQEILDGFVAKKSSRWSDGDKVYVRLFLVKYGKRIQ
jgi:hypothetical protein